MPTVSQTIQSCLDVNSSWVELFNELSILFTFDYDLDLEGTIISDYLVEECGVSESEAIAGVSQFIHNNYRLSKDWVVSNKDLVIETLDNFGGSGESDYQDFIADNA